MLADNAAMQIITNPSVFDVIVTENTFGDILSDESAVIGGSMGNQWGNIGKPLGNHWGNIGRPLGNHRGAIAK